MSKKISGVERTHLQKNQRSGPHASEQKSVEWTARIPQKISGVDYTHRPEWTARMHAKSPEWTARIPPKIS